MIYDVYPKARIHLLVLPKLPLNEPVDLSASNLVLLNQMQRVSDWIAKGLMERGAGQIKCGVHAKPSMVPLHIHIVSQVRA